MTDWNGWSGLREFHVRDDYEIQEQKKDGRFIKGYDERLQFNKHIDYRTEPFLKDETPDDDTHRNEDEAEERSVFLKHSLLFVYELLYGQSIYYFPSNLKRERRKNSSREILEKGNFPIFQNV